jgi:hypothetical protein
MIFLKKNLSRPYIRIYAFQNIAIKNGQSRDIDNTGQDTGRRKTTKDTTLKITG